MTESRRTVGLAWFGLALFLLALLVPAGVDASRKATRAETRGMWRVVDPGGRCVHHRGKISTVRTPRNRWGTIIVADRNCGNGQYVLAKRRHAGSRWRIRGAGSDWGYPARCASDRRKIPIAVLRDFFGRDHCRGSRRRAQRRVRVECLEEGRGQVYRAKPARCTMYEHGRPGYTYLSSLTWRHWGTSRAVGRGRIGYFDHPDYSGNVIVVLRRISRGGCIRGRFYTRARIRQTSGAAAGNRFTLNLAAGCPA